MLGVAVFASFTPAPRCGRAWPELSDRKCSLAVPTRETPCVKQNAAQTPTEGVRGKTAAKTQRAPGPPRAQVGEDAGSMRKRRRETSSLGIHAGGSASSRLTPRQSDQNLVRLGEELAASGRDRRGEMYQGTRGERRSLTWGEHREENS